MRKVFGLTPSKAGKIADGILANENKYLNNIPSKGSNSWKEYNKKQRKAWNNYMKHVIATSKIHKQ
ncbi:MAG: hypothetical protein LBH41_01090 [Rickettsiales bacterium]|jgi:hypothetical protein|nr:hypothetical protein [Rickettsiales bacterium]